MTLQSTKNLPVQTTVLIYGAAKIGKTWLATQCPSPVIACIDRGVSSLREFDLPFDTINSFADLNDRFFNDCLTAPYKKQFKTIIIDDLCALADMFLVAEKPRHKDPRKAYFELSDAILAFLHKFNTLAEQHGYFVVYLCKETKVVEAMTGLTLTAPMVPGKAIGPMLPYLVGEVWHMELWLDPTDNQLKRVFRTKRNNAVDAGSRYGKFGELEYANLTSLFERMKSGS